MNVSRKTACSLLLLIISPLATAGQLIINHGATLNGRGNITGDITVNSGGTVSPSTGCLSATAVDFSAGSTLRVPIRGKTACTAHGQLQARGTVNIDGATLETFTDGYTLQPDDAFVLLNKTSAGAIVGTFTGLSEGGTYRLDSYDLRVSYVAGDGNDLRLFDEQLQIIDGRIFSDSFENPP